jgi:hypothetical protein
VIGITLLVTHGGYANAGIPGCIYYRCSRFNRNTGIVYFEVYQHKKNKRLTHPNRPFRAHLFANIAFNAFILYDLVLFIRHKRNSPRRAFLRANGTANAGFVDIVTDKCLTFCRRAFSTDMGLVLFPEILKGG